MPDARAAQPPRNIPQNIPARRLPMGLPLDLHQTRRIAALEQILGPGRYQGWGQVGAGGTFFVDVLDADGEGVTRHEGLTLHRAIGAATDAARRARAVLAAEHELKDAIAFADELRRTA